MKLPWRKGASFNSGLGLGSIRFDTLGLTPEPRVEMNERYWLGSSLLLSEHWFPIPPDLPSLQEREIRAMYDSLLARQPDDDGRVSRLLHLAVHHDTPVPSVCTLMRVVVPNEHGYSFVGAVTLPLAQCSWVVKVQSSEGQITGIREAVAFHRFSKEERLPEQPIEDLASVFDPYDERWDTDEDDPLTSVRRSISRVIESLEVDPEVRRATPFRS